MTHSASGDRTSADLEKKRQEILGYYAAQDVNNDGYLSLDELLKFPLASFDCLDANDDGKVSSKEIFSGMEHCPSVNLEVYAPKP